MRFKKMTLVQVGIALLFGLFIGDSMQNFIDDFDGETTQTVVTTDNNQVYLLEVDVFSEMTLAYGLKLELEGLEIDSVVVENEISGDFRVLTDITLVENLLLSKKAGLENMGYTPTVLIVNLVDLVNSTVSDTKTYNFYKWSMYYFVDLLQNEDVTFSIEYSASVDANNVDLYNALLALSMSPKESLKPILALNVYKQFVHSFNPKE